MTALTDNFTKDVKRCAIIIQARMSSCRFPGKMMSQLFNMPLIEYVYRRCRQSSIRKILVATSDNSSDDILYNYCKEKKIPVTRGSLDNVLKRYIEAAALLDVDYISRVCGDTPFVDIELIKILLEALIKNRLDFAAPSRQKCASCFYSEAINLQALKKSAELTDDKQDLEHVTKFIISREDKFLIRFLDIDLNPAFFKGFRLTIDYPEDIKKLNMIVAALKNKFSFTSEEILNIAKEKFSL